MVYSGAGCRVDRLLLLNIVSSSQQPCGFTNASMAIAYPEIFWPCRFVWISTATSKRHVNVEGDLSKQFVAQGNMMSVRFMLLALVAMAHGIFWTAPYQHKVKLRCLGGD